MERPRPSTVAWAATVGGIALYDALCPNGEQMSERADEWMEHPIKRRLTQIGMGMIALHVCNAIRPEVDPIHKLASLHRRVNINEQET